MLFVIVVTCVTLAYGADEYNFQCKPKPGCDFSQCNAIPEHFLDIEGFDPVEYRKRNEYHISCQPKSDVSGVKGQGHDVKDFGYVTEAQMREAMQTMISALETRFEEKISKQNKEHRDEMERLNTILKTNEEERGRLSEKVKNLTSKLASMEEKSKTQPDKNVKETEEDKCQGVKWDENCYWAVVRSSFTVSFEDAEKLCGEHGHPTNIYSDDHYKELISYILKFMRAGRLWIGMTFDTQTRTVMLTSGKPSPFFKWAANVNWHRISYNQLGVYISSQGNDFTSGMNVYAKSFKLEGVVCERTMST